MNFFQQIRSSIYDPDFYLKLLDKSLGFSIGYYLKLSSVLALVVAVFFAVTTVPNLNRLIWPIGDTVVALYPDDLEIKITDGRVITNQDRTVIALPADWPRTVLSPTNLLVIDIGATPTIEDLDKADTVALLTEEAFIFRNDQDGFEIISLTESRDFELTKEILNNSISRVEPWLILVAPVLVLMLFVFVFIVITLLLLPLSILAFLVFVMVRLILPTSTGKISYGTSYRLSLHAFTLPLLFILPLAMVGLTLPAWLAILCPLFIIYLNLSVLPPSSV
jgi:hypothetical protein